MISLRQRSCALGLPALTISAILASAGTASADVTLLDFSWTSSANSSQVTQATCDDACSGGFAICTASEPSFFHFGSLMNAVNATYAGARACANSCGDSLYAYASSGVGTYVNIKPPLVAGPTQLWSFSHSIATGAEASLVVGDCGVGNASAGTSAHHDWNLAFRVSQLTEVTMNYSHAATREGPGVGPTSSWTLRDSNGVAIFEQHLGGPFGLPSDQGTLVWYLAPGDYAMQIDSEVEGLALANGPVASHSASASCELVFRPFGCSRIAAQSFDQTITSNDDLNLGVIVEPALLGREFQWQLQSQIPPFDWTDMANGTLFLASGDRVVPLGEITGAGSPTLFIDLDPQHASVLSGSRFRCMITDDCGILLSQPILVTVTDGASSCPPCPADYDQDGGVAGSDIGAFFVDFEAGATCADVDADGAVTGGDLSAFFALIEAGGC